MNNTIYLTSLNGTLGVCSLMLTTKNIFGATDGKKIKKERTKKKKKRIKKVELSLYTRKLL